MSNAKLPPMHPIPVPIYILASQRARRQVLARAPADPALPRPVTVPPRANLPGADGVVVARQHVLVQLVAPVALPAVLIRRQRRAAVVGAAGAAHDTIVAGLARDGEARRARRARRAGRKPVDRVRGGTEGAEGAPVPGVRLAQRVPTCREAL